MDKYVMRRQILEAVRQCEPAAAEVSDIESFPPIEMASIAGEELRRETRSLVERGYLKDLRPGRAPLLRLTPAGRGQVDREDDLHEYVWGQYASRFAQ